MRAVVIDRYHGPVEERELPTPKPRHDDLLVKVHAASVNPVDFKIRDGKVKVLLKYDMPLTLGNDLSGEVVAVGDQVTRFKVGDAVYARLHKDRIGSFAEYALVREIAAARKPSSLSHEEAASIPLVGLTAWQAMIDIGKLSKGQRVLVHAGSGGVGTFAIQLAKHVGAFVATTCGARNRELCQSLGADQVVDYKSERFEDVVKDVDVVFDTQGVDTVVRSYQCLRPGGIVVSVGGTPDAKFGKQWNLSPMVVLALRFMSRKITRAAKKRGGRYQYLFMSASGEQLEEIGALIDKKIIRPVIDRTFTLSEIKEALAYVEAGRTVGKVVIKVIS
jgi:alcohol dehydrogenase